MDKDYFDENKRQYAMSFNRPAIMDNSRELLINQSQDFKLSLRKKRLNSFLTSKRMMIQARQNKKLEINLSSINLPNIDIREEFTTMDDFYKLIKENLKSKNKEEIKYGIVLLKNHVNSEIEKMSKNVSVFNINIISDLFEIFDEYIEKDLLITYELLNIMINLTYTDNESKIAAMCITPLSYRLWERICKTENVDLIGNLIWLFGNVVYDNQEIAYNILVSNMFEKYILSFFEEEKYKLLTQEDQIAVIERGCSLFSKLIYKEDEQIHKDIFDLKRRMLQLLLRYYKLGNESILFSVLKSFSTIEDSIELYFDLIKHSDLIQYAMRANLQPFIQEYIVILIGNISVRTRFSVESGWAPGLEDEILLFLIEALKAVRANLRKVALWCLSNVAADSQEITTKLINNQNCISQAMQLLREEKDKSIVTEIVFFFSVLINASGCNEFFTLMNNHLFPLLLESIQKFEASSSILTILFQTIGTCLKQGELIRNQLNENVILTKFLELGGKDLLEKYQNTQNVKLYNIIQEIMFEFFNVKELVDDIHIR